MDGGGSGLRVAVCRPDLTVVGQSRGEAVNPGSVSREVAAERLRRAITEALDSAGASSDDIAALGMGVAGAAVSHSREWLMEVFAPFAPGARLALSADYEIALVGAHGRRLGIIVIAGTGSVAYGVDPEGRSALVGGWGPLIGDEGSGYWLGREALRAVARAADGRGPETALTGEVLGALGVSEARALIPGLYQGRGAASDEIARLAPLVLEAASAGDPVARGLVETATDELARLVAAVSARLDVEDAPVALAGGLLAQENPLSRALRGRLGPTVIAAPMHPPVLGAVILAREALKP